MEALVQKAIERYGKIDILVNNAGISQRSLIKDTDFSVYKELMDIDYLGTLVLSKALLPHFITKKDGHYVTVTSLMGKFGSPFRSGYCGAKHALHGFFDVMRMEHEKNHAGRALPQNQDDTATLNGLSPNTAAKKIIRAIVRQKFEVYVGGGEVKGVYLKRFFPKLLHKVVLKSQVR